ncbi:MAG: histone deacetylase family protein [Pseudomonadota bacterium]
MTTALLTHNAGLNHVTPTGHPERVDRLMAIYAMLDTIADPKLMRVDAPLGTADDVLRAHPQAHIDAITSAAPASGYVSLDADTHMSPGSLEAAYRCVGGSVKAVDMVLAGEVQNAFVAMRPPGHHAEAQRPMGFCLFGHVAIAAKHALDHHGLERVAVVDFDVHHGNGTQDLLWDEARSLFISTHQMPLYPGSGAVSETGAHGNVLNVPLPPYADGRVLRQAYERVVLPALNDFEPELILISAGFDAHQADPLANLNFTESDFAWATEQLCDIADRHAMGRVVSSLEGGYDLAALAASTKAHLTALLARGS